MDRSKLPVIVGIVVVLIVVIFGVSRIFRTTDTTQAELSNALIAQETLIDISIIAKDKATGLTTLSRAASIAATISSNRVTLANYYKELYKNLPKNTEETVIADFKDTFENFDTKYRDAALKYLAISLENLQKVRAKTTNETFATDLDNAIDNHQIQIDALNSL